MIQARLYFQEGSSTGSQFPAGIHSAVEFTGMVRNQDWWELTYAKNGYTISKYLFAPKGKFTYDDETPEDAFLREMNANIDHVVHILRIVLGDEKAAMVEDETYDGFMEKSATILSDYKGALVNLKVGVNKKKPEYTELSKYPSYVERFVEGREPKLKFSKREQEVLDENRTVVRNLANEAVERNQN